MILLISSISAVRPAAIMKPVHVRRILVIWLSFAAHFHVTMDQLILCDLEAEHFIPDSEYSSGMRETVTPYMQGIEKIPVTTSISPKKKWILYSHSVLLPMRSVNSLPVFFTQINNCLSFFLTFLRLPVQIRHELHSLLFQYLLPESVP